MLGLFEPTVMTFGLTNAPPMFQAFMNDILAEPIMQEWFSCYMDDGIMGNDGDIDELTRMAKIVFDIFEKHDLFIRPEKSDFFVTEVDFLGFRFKDGKLAMEEQKVSGILDWPAPTSVTQVRSFIGFCNYY